MRHTTKAHKHYRKVCAMIRATIIAILVLLSLLLIITACGTNNEATPESKPTVTVPDSELSIPDDLETIPETSTPNDSEPEVVEWKPDRESVEALAKTLWGECRGVKYKSHQAAVAWCVLNRLDTGRWGDTVLEVVSAPSQFSGYNDSFPVTDELVALAEDVLIRWHAEKEGEQNVGRVLPKSYIFFVGDGKLNYFTDKWKSKDYWDWSLPNPYES